MDGATRDALAVVAEARPRGGSSWIFGHRLREGGLLGSMGRVASSVDNSMIEPFWSTLKVRLPGCLGVARLVGELSLQKV